MKVGKKLVNGPGQWNCSLILIKAKNQRGKSKCTKQLRWGAKKHGAVGVNLQPQRKQVVTQSFCHSTLEWQIIHSMQQPELKTKEGCKLSKKKDRPWKFKTIYNQILQFDNILRSCIRRGDSKYLIGCVIWLLCKYRRPAESNSSP